MMNEQIKELAEQAGFVLWQDESHNPGDVIDWGSRYDDELVKFAELIIREMLVLTYDEETRYYNQNEDRLAKTMEDYRKLAKEHFEFK